MIELRTFGALGLRDSSGRELRSILAQPKRLALLAYLAVASPGPFHRRDSLLPLFWPELDEARARAALSRALHFLRVALGEGVLLNRGDEQLSLAPERLSSDVAHFRDLRDRGRLAEALELYRGDFLEGFFVSDAPELERWIDGERQRFRHSTTDAARTLSLSAEADGDLALALHWARQASSYAPYDETDARRIILLLGRSGDRGAAIDFFQRFARRLREELELHPSPETIALRDAIAAPPQEDSPAAAGQLGAAPVKTRNANGVAAALPRVGGGAAAAAARLPDNHPVARRRSRLRLAALALLPIFAVGAPLVWNSTIDRASAVRRSPSIAVLPLANVSADSGSQYFSDGMTDELIAALSQVRGLRVAARTSSFVYKSSKVPVSEIARALNVDVVLEGSARREGSRLRITLQLVRAAEGYTLWSKTYDRERSDVFALQQEISRDVADALEVRLVRGDGVASARSTDPETHDLYLWGRYHWNLRTREGLLEAAEIFERVIARDPSYAPAYAGLADSYGLLVVYDQPPREIMPKAKAAALRALELDESLSEAHAALAYVAAWYEWDWDTAETHFKRALELSPSNATAHHWYSIYLGATGRLVESLREMDDARELDPAALMIRGASGVRLYMARDYAGAVQQLEPALRVAQNRIPARPWLALAYLRLGRTRDAIALLETDTTDVPAAVMAALAMAYARAGRTQDARALVRALESRAERGYFARSWLVRAQTAIGDTARALTWLERAHEERDGWLTFAKVEPTFDPLREAPRFQEILGRMRLR